MVGPGPEDDLEDDFEDEDTDPALDATPPKDEPSVELIWVEEPGRGMVLKVFPVRSRYEQ
jgi:hypothetical protein